MSREEENSDASSNLNDENGAAGFTTLEDVIGNSENSDDQIWGPSWKTPGGGELQNPTEFLQPSSSLVTRQGFPSFMDSSFNIWRSSSSDDEESKNFQTGNSLFIPTPIRQSSSLRSLFPIASADIPLDPNPFEGLPEKVSRKRNVSEDGMDHSGAFSTDQQSSLDASNNLNWQPELLSSSFFVGDTWGMMQNWENWQVPDMFAGIPPNGQPVATFNGASAFSKYFPQADNGDTKEDAMKEAEPNSSTSGLEDFQAAKLGICVYPARQVNFSNLCAQFTVQVFNLPKSCNLASGMIEAIAECPSGIPTICIIKMDTLRQYSSTMQSFQGFFKATDEVGLYKLRVRLVLPLALCRQTPGAVAEVIHVLVTRNYLRESNQLTSQAYQLQYERQDDSAATNVWGLACDKMTNRLYYSERLGNRVLCMDPNDGRILFQFGNPGSVTFNRPSGIACDEINRRVLVCDKDNHQVASFSMDGEFLGAFGGQGFHNGLFNYPWDVATSPLGTHIAVSDSRNKRVQLFDLYGKYLDKYSVFEKNPFVYKTLFDYPRGITFGSKGECVFATDFNTQNVLKIPLDMSTSERLVPEGQLRRPQGLIVDDVGTLLVTDSKNNCLRHMAGDGTLLSTIRYVGGIAVKHPVNLAKMPGGLIAFLDGDGKIHII